MKIGEIAGPIQAPNGFHIIKLIGKRNNKIKMPTKAEIEQIIFRQKFEKALPKWLDKIRKTAYIKIVTPQ